MGIFKRISHDTFFEGDPFEKIRQSASATLETFNELTNSIQSSAKKINTSLNVSSPKSIGDLKEQNKAIEDANRLEASNERIKRERIKTEHLLADVQEKANAKIAKESEELKKQSGIYGQLIKRRSELRGELFAAKTVDDIKRINNELFIVNGKIKDVKEGGVKAFNSWSNAIQSFQFKFNSLGSSIGGFFGGIAAQAVSGLIDKVGEYVVEQYKVITGINDRKQATDALNESDKEQVENLKDLNKELKDLNKESDKNKARANVLFGDKTDSKSRYDLIVKEGQDALKEIEEKFKKKEDDLIENAAKLNVKITTETVKGQRLLASRNKTFSDKIQSLEDEKNKEILIANKRFSVEKQKIQLDEIERLSAAADKAADDEIKKNKEKKKSITGKIEITDPFGNKLAGQGQTLEDYEKLEKEKTDAQIEEYNRRQKNLNEFIEYELKAIEGLYGEEERVINLARLERNINDGSANEKELEAWKKLQKDKLDVLMEANKNIIDNTKQIASIVTGIFSDQSNAEVAINDRKISELDKQIDYQRQRALNGDLNSLDKLEEERAKELENREALRKKQANIERAEKLADLFIEFYKVYSKDKEKAYGKALTETLKAKAGGQAIKSLGSFMDGTEDTGNANGSGVDGRGGMLSILHPNEAVIKKGSNKEASGLAKMWNADGLEGVKMWAINNLDLEGKKDSSVNSNLDLLNEFKKLNKTLSEKTDLEFKRNVIGELVEIERRAGVISETTFKQAKTSYSKR